MSLVAKPQPASHTRAVIVTGAGRGIGRAIARRFAAAGDAVWFTDLDSDAARAASDAAEGGLCFWARMDVRDPEAIARVVGEVEARRGGVDVLINNAGRMTQGPFQATPAGAFQDMLDVNVGGLFHCVRAVAPRMVERRRGSIINIASVSAQRGGGAVGNVWYGTTKAAVVAMTSGLARELGPSGVRVNAISPGVVETDMVRTFMTPQVRERVLTRFPLGRLATVDDVARMALFLASDEAAFVTGQTVAVDGGFLSN
ncbi:SDR family NAD(P)-dependent oxidoreductase [Variovorax sp. RA8]|uniref:SDR family NAD(P)-dependent oxidoreductase n=1 Tax=Variovorax sp. (strain JCM 16519 / RA8) TaxID=662548 RepID=UPI001318DD14|nr:SDR family oxidoreductase [Variovorax sp. RA8]VTU27474.1 3-oxoacyl-[acyl-carrier-protein] reductase FabG [Variovorax sp. RA8]